MEIRIYSTSGHLVRSVKSAPGSQAIWDGKNEVGNPLPLGRYFVGISSLEGLFSADFLWVR
jgi:flagellar hook assembly protein FlgD